jgi:hypothetical protein
VHGQHRAFHRAEGCQEDDPQPGVSVVQPGKDLFT